MLDAEYDGKEEGQDIVLYIMPDEFAATFEPYVAWKRQSGLDVIVTKFSEISATANNPVTIKNYVTTLYTYSENPPTYVVMVGDDGIFPTKIVTYPDYSFPDEDYFAKVDGNDMFPDLLPGRIPVQTASRLEIVLNKFKIYEKTPYTAEPSWFMKSLCCSNNAYESQKETKRFTAQIMREDGGFKVDTLLSDGDYNSGCTVNLAQVIAKINEGRGFLNYRGEGWSSGWHANCYYFSTDDVSNLTNGSKFTFVTSIGCGVAMFNSYGGNCFGEQWIKTGTLDDPRGAIAFVGPTSNTHTAYNNQIDKGIYIGMFQEGLSTPGQALVRGKLQMYNVYGASDYYVNYHYTVYCVLGDPSVKIWKITPLPVTVVHPEFVVLGQNQTEISVSFAVSGLPVSNATITIQGSEIFAKSKTDNIGKAIFDLNLETIETLTITVTSEKTIPYIGTMSTVVGIENNNQALGFSLKQNTPNPFDLTTEISFSLNKTSEVSLQIFSLKGDLIRTICNEKKSAGDYTIKWDGLDGSGKTVESGIYFYRLKTNSDIKTMRMLKLK